MWQSPFPWTVMVFIFLFRASFVSEILNAQAVCFLSIDLVVAIVMCVFINEGEMKRFEKSCMYNRKHIH